MKTATAVAAATIAASVACCAGSARAQNDFTVRIGGDAYFEAAGVSQRQDAGARMTEFTDRFRLNIVAAAKPADGPAYGARLRIRAVGAANGGAAATDYDRAYIYVDGRLGSLKLGVNNSYNDEFNFAARPLDYIVTPLPDTAVEFASRTATTQITAAAPVVTNIAALTLTDNARGTKAVYISPRVAGLQLGGSYTPQPFSHGPDVDRTENAAAGFQDIWELGLTYKREFSGLGVYGSFAYMAGRNEMSDAAGLRSLQAGLSLDYAGFTLGGGYVNRFDSGLSKGSANRSALQVRNVGLQYAAGPLVVGLGYTDGVREGLQGVAADDRQRTWSIGAGYALAPGLRVGAEYLNVRFDDEAGVDDRANILALRTTLFF
jgi:outer membrane protein OmpU